MIMELWMLIGVVIVFTITIMVQVLTFIFTIGPVRAAGNRENVPELMCGIAGRVQRAISNQIEGLAMFAPLVLVTAIAGLSTPMTVLATQIYMGSRIAHALSYIIGIVWLRTVFFVIGVFAIMQLLVAMLWG